MLHCKFSGDYNSERIFKIGQYLTKLCVQYLGFTFFGPPCICPIAIVPGIAWDSFTSICLTDCYHSYCHSSHSILMKLCTVVWNQKGKIQSIRGSKSDHSFPYFVLSPILTHLMHCQWQGVNTSFKSCAVCTDIDYGV